MPDAELIKVDLSKINHYRVSAGLIYVNRCPEEIENPWGDAKEVDKSLCHK